MDGSHKLIDQLSVRLEKKMMVMVVMMMVMMMIRE